MKGIGLSIGERESGAYTEYIHWAREERGRSGESEEAKKRRSEELKEHGTNEEYQVLC